jgi:8-oxo-dGTP pyrophosphatase MutT (NUDIX family)
VRFEDAVRSLTRARGVELPGPAAQGRLAPRPRRAWVPGMVPEGLREAAGLALIWPRDGEATLLLTVRGAHLSNHRGQVSLPGGAVDPGETIEQAALREAAEEVALAPERVVVRLLLTPLHIPVSGYVLHPVVATSATVPDVHPVGGEVDRIVDVPLEELADGRGLAVENRERDGATIEVPYFDLGGSKLWGATAMVVAELLAVLGRPVDPWALG